MLEEKRDLFEDIEIIEDAISKRFQRNPQLYYIGLDKLNDLTNEDIEQPSKIAISDNKIYKSKKLVRSRKQEVVQQHEIQLFLIEYNKKRKQIKTLSRKQDKTEPKFNIDEEVRKFHVSIDVLKGSGVLSTSLTEKRQNYSMFSGTSFKIKPNDILSRKAADIRINDIFSRDEQYGKYLELEKFHSNWLNVIKRTDCSSYQFVKQIECLLDMNKYIRQPPVDRKSIRYVEFLLDFCSYIESFFQKKYCLIDQKAVEIVLNDKFKKYIDTPLIGDEDKQFCIACSKGFKSYTVFESHLGGKVHKKNVSKRGKALLSEYKLHIYLNLMKDEFDSSKEFIERKQAFSAEERMDELKTLNKLYNQPNYLADENEDSSIEDDNNKMTSTEKSFLDGTFNMPLGPDGLPIPYWLYKLQGLDVNYTCEICSNEVFKGRRRFEKHFNESKHQYHLQCLGIKPSFTFKGVTSIEEAKSLWNNIQDKNADTIKLSPNNVVTMAVEVEDKNGNVMSQQDYEELKKQGLL